MVWSLFCPLSYCCSVSDTRLSSKRGSWLMVMTLAACFVVDSEVLLRNGVRAHVPVRDPVERHRDIAVVSAKAARLLYELEGL